MSFLKSIKYTMILTSALYILMGVVFVSGMAEGVMYLYALSAGLAVIGLLNVVRYFMMKIDVKFKRNDFVIGAILTLIGAVLYLRKDEFVLMIPFIFGIMLFIDGIFKMQDGFDIARFSHNCALQFSAAIIVLILGGLLMTDKFIVFMDGLDKVLLPYVIGGGLIFAGVSDIVSNFFLAAYKASYDKHKDEYVSESYQSDQVMDPEDFAENKPETDEEEQKAA